MGKRRFYRAWRVGACCAVVFMSSGCAAKNPVMRATRDILRGPVRNTVKAAIHAEQKTQKIVVDAVVDTLAAILR